jgi:hypothetical protein
LDFAGSNRRCGTLRINAEDAFDDKQVAGGKVMIKSPTRSLAQLLASHGNDEDDIFVARAINPVKGAAGADQGQSSSDHGQGKTGIIRLEGGVDYHKLSMTMSMLRSLSGADAGNTASTSETGDESGADDTTDHVAPSTATGTTPPTGPVDTGTVSPPTDPGTDGTGPDPGPGTDPGPDVDTTVYATAGDDILSGGDGVDTFVFGPHGGNDIITNFDVGNDILDLRAYGFASAEEALSHAVDDGGSLALVIGADMITFHDVTFAQAADLSILFV